MLTAPATCRFGRFELDATTRQLRANGKPIALGARAFDVLLALVQRHGRLVTKDELMELVWPGLVVEDNNLQVQISALRKALGANAIATIAGRGYRFALDTSPSGQTRSAREPARHNLPHPLTSFIGHEDDLRAYGELLGQTRLLTLTGIGGCGKTRLAIKLAESILPSFPDGVWFVDLAPPSDAEGVPLHVATMLGIRKQADQPWTETLCEYVAGRNMLLVLDNCEHVSAMCAELTQRLLGAAPGLRVLATSREGLNVHGERTVTVRSLALPVAGPENDLQRFQSSEAVRLFAERAQLAVSRFAIDATTAPVVAEICRRLDGIPLAIELAAARVKVLSVDEIRMRLHDRFRLLTGHAAALPRQQTLLAAIQWSYDHLAPDEQRLLRLLSVFAAGWTLAGAVRVIDEDADEYEVLDVLTRLVDLSLVMIEQGKDGGTRYAMLETVRQYAQDQLNQSREGNIARSRHLKFFVAFAEQAAPQLNGRAQGIWLARLKSESANLLQAASVCDLVEDGAHLGMRLVHALLDFWFHLGLIELGHQVTLAALGRVGATARNQVRAKALIVAGTLSRSVERRDEANAHSREALSIAREIRNDRLAVEALLLVGQLANDRASSASALEVLREALTLASALGDKALVARVLNATGEVHRVAGNYEAAQPLYQQSLELARQQENTFLIATVCDNLARVFVSRGLPDHALNLIQEVLAISLTAGSKWTALCAFDVATGLGAAAADWTFAARMRGAAEARLRDMKYKRDPPDEAFLAPWTVRIREALGETAYATAFGSGLVLSHEQAVEEALAWVGKRLGSVTQASSVASMQDARSPRR